MMKAMGWREGQTLGGSSGSGAALVTPLAAAGNVGNAGLGLFAQQYITPRSADSSADEVCGGEVASDPLHDAHQCVHVSFVCFVVVFLVLLNRQRLRSGCVAKRPRPGTSHWKEQPNGVGTKTSEMTPRTVKMLHVIMGVGQLYKSFVQSSFSDW